MTNYVIGVDEVGRGSLAGDVYAAGVLVPVGTHPIDGIGDSKTLSPRRRRELHDALITCDVIRFFVSQETAGTIDQIGIAKAVQRCFEMCARQLITHSPGPVTEILVDGIAIPGWAQFPCPTRFIPKGDATEWSIGAASIIAKVRRDAYMVQLGELHPHYQWGQNAGYGTAGHEDAIRVHGLSPHHRKSFCRKFAAFTRPAKDPMESTRQRYAETPLLDLTDLFE